MKGTLCEQCGHPIVVCSAIAHGRHEAIKYLRLSGYSATDAKRIVFEHIPELKKEKVMFVVEEKVMPNSGDRSLEIYLNQVQQMDPSRILISVSVGYVSQVSAGARPMSTSFIIVWKDM